MNYNKKLSKLAVALLKIGRVKETYNLSETINYLSDHESSDRGMKPWVVDIEDLTKGNKNFRTTEWTGKFMQMTVMSIEPDEDIGLEVHHDVDQFIRIEGGRGTVLMGDDKDDLNQTWEVEDDFAIFIPAGTWHNIVNDGDEELKVYSIYAAPEHPAGTIHKTKEDAEIYELEHHEA